MHYQACIHTTIHTIWVEWIRWTYKSWRLDERLLRSRVFEDLWSVANGDIYTQPQVGIFGFSGDNPTRIVLYPNRVNLFSLECCNFRRLNFFFFSLLLMEFFFSEITFLLINLLLMRFVCKLGWILYLQVYIIEIVFGTNFNYFYFSIFEH